MRKSNLKFTPGYINKNLSHCVSEKDSSDILTNYLESFWAVPRDNKSAVSTRRINSAR